MAVLRVNAGGTGLRNLTREIKSASEPAWSPDGKGILFIDLETEPAEPQKIKSSAIYLMKSDGSGKKLLFRLEGVAQRPEWSADGRRIVFQLASTDLKDIQVEVADIPSGNPHSITPHADGRKLWDETPSWTPDGRLVFGSDRDGRMKLYMMNADGSEQRRLTF
jgi:TolB protein